MAEPDGPTDAKFREALVHHQSGQIQIAAELYQQLLDSGFDHTDVLGFYGVAAFQLGQSAKGIELLHAALEKDPANIRACGNLGVVLEAEGRLDEAEAAYQQALRIDPYYTESLFNLGNVLLAQGRYIEAEAAYARAVETNPAHAQAYNNLGLALREQGRASESVTALRRALEIDPGYVEALNNLGLSLRAAKETEEAEASFRRVLELRPDYADAISNLGVLLHWKGELTEAETLLRRAIKLRPGAAGPLANLGATLQKQGRYEDAEAAFREAIRHNPDHAESHFNLGIILLLTGRFAEGWKENQWRWRAKDFPSERRTFDQPLWDGSALAGRRLLIYAEQGLGDAIQLVRLAAGVKGGEVYFECPEPLARLFKTANGIDRVIVHGEALPGFDVQVPAFELPGALNVTLQTIPDACPYLHADGTDVARWRERIGGTGGFKVGLVWAGKPNHANDRERSMGLEAMQPLLEVPNVEFYSLQMGEKRLELEAVPDLARRICDLAPQIEDFADTAAALDCLDLLITVDTSVAHLAGALGRPAWVMIPFAPDWRWMREGGTSPWYPSLRLFRQQAPDEGPAAEKWAPVVARMVDELAELAGAKEPRGGRPS
ncbi:MAG: tetratricopeptide repeat protein [Rhodospirillales bacterium]|nr:tetratricopeptide repeat protein [Rhodospirillales bacterium]